MKFNKVRLEHARYLRNNLVFACAGYGAQLGGAAQPQVRVLLRSLLLEVFLLLRGWREEKEARRAGWQESIYLIA